MLVHCILLESFSNTYLLKAVIFISAKCALHSLLLQYFHRFSVSLSYYGLSLGADSLSDNLYVSCALMGLVELPGLLVCILTVDRLV